MILPAPGFRCAPDRSAPPRRAGLQFAVAIAAAAAMACENEPRDRFADERERVTAQALAVLERDGFRIYRNANPEFVVAYPAAILRPDGMSGASGQRFISDDNSVVMTATVQAGADTTALRRVHDAAIGGLEGESLSAPASPLPNARFVVTRHSGDRVRYVKAVLLDGQLAVLTFEFDSARAGDLAGLIPRVAGSFPG